MNISKKINRIYILSFIFSFHVAISAYVNSSFLTNFISEKYIGILYTLSSVLALFLLSKSVNILKNFGNKKLTILFLFINILSLIGLIFSSNPYLIGISFISFLSTNTLIFFCIDIFVEHFSDPSQTGKTRGLYLTIVNIAWMLSPLVAAFMITKEGGYKAIYSLALLMVSIMTIGLMMSVKTFKDQKYKTSLVFCMDGCIHTYILNRASRLYMGPNWGNLYHNAISFCNFWFTNWNTYR